MSGIEYHHPDISGMDGNNLVMILTSLELMCFGKRILPRGHRNAWEWENGIPEIALIQVIGI